ARDGRASRARLRLYLEDAARIRARGLVLFEGTREAATGEGFLQTIDDGVDRGTVAVVLGARVREVPRTDGRDDRVVPVVLEDLELADAGVALRVELRGAIPTARAVPAQGVVVTGLGGLT